jgi:hypothetical protein
LFLYAQRGFYRGKKFEEKEKAKQNKKEKNKLKKKEMKKKKRIRVTFYSLVGFGHELVLGIYGQFITSVTRRHKRTKIYHKNKIRGGAT